MKKPDVPAREFISPSDLTFGLSTCKRCLWIKYWYKVILPGAFPLVGTFSAMQEKNFRGFSTTTISSSLRPGKVTKLGEWVRSTHLKVDGETTRWRINGKYDLVAENDDGTVALIDCKVSDSTRDSGEFYAPQLEAYAYALEQPANGRAIEVASIGLLVWKPEKVIEQMGAFGISMKQTYIPVDRDVEKFTNVIGELIEMLEGPLPDAGLECVTCNYLVERLALEE
jgi:CRISPR/Cas system-associated exonuclease Cas4 (RecB family)